MKTNLLILVLLLGGCTTELKQARHVGLAKKHASKAGLEFCKDSVIVDTIRTETLQHDTLFKVKSVHDTIVYQDKILEYKYFYNTIDSTIYLQAQCKGDTVFKDRTVIVKEPVTIDNTPEWIAFSMKWWWVLVVIAFILTTIGILKKLKVW